MASVHFLSCCVAPVRVEVVAGKRHVCLKSNTTEVHPASSAGPTSPAGASDLDRFVP